MLANTKDGTRGNAPAIAAPASSDAVAPAFPAPTRFIHLLFVPTLACQLRCTYCYLDERALAPLAPDPAALPTGCPSPHEPLDTLKFAVQKFRDAGVMPFTIALHGGEVTCLPKNQFAHLVSYIAGYYRDNAREIESHGFKVGRPHIKTNLFGIDRHIDAIRDFGVSVSGSIDLPLSMHDEYRLTANGRSSLGKILENVSMLEKLPNKKKASATIFHEHFERIDEIVADLRFLHENTCLDMNDFNFMIGFADEHCPLTPLTPAEQVAFYERMHEEFDGTDLDAGVNGPWFAEFTPAYCTGCMNCGEKFFLVDAAGDVFSCVRGQGHDAFRYSNVYADPIERILETARTKIFLAHNESPLPEACARCPYLRYCKTGCPFVKTLYGSGSSYTCKLQQAMYRRDPELYPPARDPRSDAYRYARIMRPAQAIELAPKRVTNIPGDIPPLEDVIAADPRIAPVFDANAFRIRIDGTDFPMESQVMRPARQIVELSRDSECALYVRHDIMEASTPWPVNNSVYLQLLSGNLVTYGDENRTKQEHVATLQVYLNSLARRASDVPGFYRLDLMPLIHEHFDDLSRGEDRPNNLFATTSALRDAHYTKHKNNAYYHIQTINLPFPNIEFVIDEDEGEEDAEGGGGLEDAFGEARGTDDLDVRPWDGGTAWLDAGAEGIGDPGNAPEEAAERVPEEHADHGLDAERPSNGLTASGAATTH